MFQWSISEAGRWIEDQSDSVDFPPLDRRHHVGPANLHCWLDREWQGQVSVQWDEKVAGNRFQQVVWLQHFVSVEDLCVIWEDHLGFRRKTSWVLVVGLPLLLGPVLSLFLEFVFSLIHKLDGNISTDIRNYALFSFFLVCEGTDLFSK